MALTKITGQVINNTTGLVVGVTTVGGGVSATDGFFSGIVTAVGDASFSGNVSVGGTLTYEDVTNIDAVGLVTARNGIVVGSGITLSKDGDIFATGVTTSTTFSGSGASLTNLPAGQLTGALPAISGANLTGIAATDNVRTGILDVAGVGTFRSNIFQTSGRIVRGSTSTIQDGDAIAGGVNVTGTDMDASIIMSVFGNDSDFNRISGAKSRNGTIGNHTVVNDGDVLLSIKGFGSDGTDFEEAAQLEFQVDGSPGDNDMPGRMVFKTTADGAASPSERLRITRDGAIGIAGANYGTSGQVLSSQGSGSAVQWASVGGMTLLSSATLSSSGTTAANITFSTTGYEYLYGKIYGVTRPSSANISDYGLRWNGTSSNVYKYVMQRMDNNGSISTYGNNSASQFYVNMQGVAAFSSGINQAVFELHLINDGVRKPFNMKHSGELSSGPIVLTTDGYYDNTAAITSLEITTYDTDINGGTLKLYGVR